ncbi:UNVERIFIED_CONTAM: hypothetical protein HDU68_008625 [Siphonaria sp. JEL0065]|nr:hypothetical protein HDU68_008625 [Siphonaria sp. JEL0065]
MNGEIFLMYDPSSDVDVLNLRSISPNYPVERLVHLPDAAIKDSPERCDIKVSRNCLRMVVLSSRCHKLAWWDVTEPKSPRLLFQSNAAIEKGWVNCYLEPNFDHIVVFDKNNNNLHHICFSSLSESVTKADQTDEPLISVTRSITQPVKVEEDEEFIGLGNDPSYEVQAEKEFKTGRTLNLGSSCYAGAIHKNWFIAGSENFIHLWDLSGGPDPIDTLYLDTQSSSLSISQEPTIHPFQNNFSIYANAINMTESSDSSLVVAIGFTRGFIALVEITDGKFSLPTLTVVHSGGVVAVNQIHISDAGVLITMDESASLTVFGWYRDADSLQISSDLQLVQNNVRQWTLVETGDTGAPFGIVWLNESGEVYRCQIGATVTAPKKEIHLPRSFVEDKCGSMECFGDLVAFQFAEKFLLLDLGSQKIVQL